MKNNRLISFILVSFAYIVSITVGIVIYNSLNFHFAINLLISDVTATIVVFIFSLLFKNASTYDPYWSVQPIVIVVALFLKSNKTILEILPLIVILIWGIRLTTNWAYTFKNLYHEDWRYKMLREKTKSFYPIINLLGIHMFPTLVVYMCVLPVVYLYQYNGEFSLLTVIFSILGLGAVILQGTADYQMHKFRKSNIGGFIRTGLWKYSRHPNYLGEIIIWWAMGLLSVCALKEHVYLLLGALMNTLMFVFVSIPMAEKNQAKRKTGFSDYKKQTRMLFPLKRNIG